MELTANTYLCDCTNGDVIVESISPTAQEGKSTIFKKIDTSTNKVILKNVTNGGFVEDVRTSDLEITEHKDSVTYVHI